MSASCPVARPHTQEISLHGSEPFTPKPLVADILRTRYCIPGSIFLVEGVDIFQASKSKRWRGIRLLLGDGELCIQALLSGDMHGYVDRGDVAIGAYVKLESFNLERTASEVSASEKGKEKDADDVKSSGIAYLVVESLIVVGWNNRLLAMLDAEKTTPAEQNEPAQVQEVKQNGDEEIDSPVASPKIVSQQSSKSDADFWKEVADANNNFEIMDVPQKQTAAIIVDSEAEVKYIAQDTTIQEQTRNAEADDDFEVMDPSQEKIAQKRAEIAAKTSSTAGYSAPVDSEYLPWSIDRMDPSKPLKLTPLRSIPNLPYKQNWSTNVLAVIASISDLQSSTLPPFSQRVARLAHPSTPKQVHLTVFLDAQEFTPSVGSVVLLLGVKNHRFDGGSLKKYASDKPKNGSRWWFDNPVQFTWCDVEGLRAWWRQIHMK